MNAMVTAVHDNGEIIQLVLRASPALLAEQARVVSRHAGQLPFDALHVTLGASADLPNADLPAPPACLEFASTAELVTRADKTSTYVRVSESSQQALRRYVQAIEAALGVTGIYNAERVFHASLTNLTGTPHGSIAKVWEYPAVPA